MRTLKKTYDAPQIVNQGSAIRRTAGGGPGSCWDGAPQGDLHYCWCAANGSGCKPEEDL